MLALTASFMARAKVLIVLACVSLLAPATVSATDPLLVLVDAQTQVTTEVHPKAGVDTLRDAHDFNTDAVRIMEAQKLRGKAWVRWVLRWNREQYQRAQRDIRIETRTGSRIETRGNTTISVPWVSTTSYGHGPVLLFNPFVEPDGPPRQPPIIIRRAK